MAPQPRSSRTSPSGGVVLMGCLAGLILLAGVLSVILLSRAGAPESDVTPAVTSVVLQPGETPVTPVPSGAAPSETAAIAPPPAATAVPPSQMPPSPTPPPTWLPPTIVPTAAPALAPSATPIPTLTPPPEPHTPAFRILPDSELVNSPSALDFSPVLFIQAQSGYIREYRETVFGREMSAAASVEFVAASTSVNPRLLLALLEYKAGWLSNPGPDSGTLDFPLGEADPERKGLTRQLMWAANMLNTGYYAYKTRGEARLSLPGGDWWYAPELNAGTVGVQYFFAQNAPDSTRWLFDVSPQGLFATYQALFGDPFARTIEPLVPPDLVQPAFSLPFRPGESWYFTAGPHGGWDRRGSAWGAVDFAPPRPTDETLRTEGRCHVSTYYARAIADGVISRARDGAVVLDLDMDGDERTGWSVLYLHIAIRDRITVGSVVSAGAALGHPSCEGFFLNSVGTHLHIARRYNGEWIAAECPRCLPGVAAPAFVMGGWQVRLQRAEVSYGWLEGGGDALNPTGVRIEMGDPITW